MNKALKSFIIFIGVFIIAFTVIFIGLTKDDIRCDSGCIIVVETSEKYYVTDYVDVKKDKITFKDVDGTLYTMNISGVTIKQMREEDFYEQKN